MSKKVATETNTENALNSHELIQAWATKLRGWSIRPAVGVTGRTIWWILRDNHGDYVGEFPTLADAIRRGAEKMTTNSNSN